MKEHGIKQFLIGIALIASCALPGICSAQTVAKPESLRAGAAKIDITPPLQPMSNGWPETLRDHLYVRAIVLDNGTTRAALINADQGGLSDAIWNDASKRVAAELQCPIENILISAIHTHSDGGPFARNVNLPSTRPPGGRGTTPGQPGGNSPQGAARGPAPGSGPNIADAIVKAVQEAKAQLEPAVIGFGTGNVYLNVNRDAVNPTTKLWYQGPNVNAPSDKTIAVVTIKTPSGDPIANHYDDKEVAIFTQSASGDQNPLYTNWNLSRTIRAANSAATGNSVSVNTSVRPDSEAIQKATEEMDQLVKAEGQIVAQEVMRVSSLTDNFAGDVRIWGGTKTVECPGRTRTDSGCEGMAGQYVDGSPVHIRLGVLTVGPIAFGAVNAEVYNEIWLRLKSEAPFRDSMMVTLTDGNAGSGYIPDDESFSHNTFEVLSSRLKPGCAEDGIVNGIVGLMDNSMNQWPSR